MRDPTPCRRQINTMALRLGFFALLIAIYGIGYHLAAITAPAWMVASLMGVVFLALVAAMYVRVLPAVLALPILAVSLAAIAGMRWQDIFTTVVQDGSIRLGKWIIAAILGSVLAQVVEKTGIAQTAIKKTAELGGDRPMILAVLLTGVIAILFTTLGGLGAVIMVATIVIPILLSLGLRPLFVGCLFLLAMSLGGAFNLVNWQFYQAELHLTQGQILAFALPFAGLMLLATVAFMLIEGKRMGKARYKAMVAETDAPVRFVPWYALLTPIVPLVPVLFFALLPKFYHAPAQMTVSGTPTTQQVTLVREVHGEPTTTTINLGEKNTGKVITVTPGQYAVVHQMEDDSTVTTSILTIAPWTKVDLAVEQDAAGGAVTVTPTETSTVYDFPITVALLFGILFGAIATYRKGQSTVQLLTKSAFDGVGAVGPALILMIGIGMVLNATMSPQVSAVIQPMLKSVVPQGHSTAAMLGYVLLFTLLAPLALYRGPLNLYGMGAGLIGALNGLMPGGAIMGAFMSVGMIQGVCDPTNTHNVWIANYTNTDVQDILKRTIPYMWVLAVIGLALSGVLYYLGVVK